MQLTAPNGVSSTLGGLLVSVNANPAHTFSKSPALEAMLLAGLGVEGDAHCGTTVRHRFARRKEPERPNLRQVHLLAEELFAELAGLGHRVGPGDLGENHTTRGVDQLALPTGTVLRVGDAAAVRLTGLRTPCTLIDGFQAGLRKKMWGLDEHGQAFRRAGVMAVVESGGVVRPGDPLAVVLPPEPHEPLAPV
jgi:MOSC domain-containing protein YiiM